MVINKFGRIFKGAKSGACMHEKYNMYFYNSYIHFIHTLLHVATYHTQHCDIHTK